MPLVPDPPPEPLRQALDDLVRWQRDTSRGRHHPSAVHAGTPTGGAHASFEVPWAGAPGRGPAAPPMDLAVRADVVGRLLDRSHGAGDLTLLWLCRPGDQEDPDEDSDEERAWLAAALAAAGERDADPLWVVVTRRGWRDPRSGVGRQTPR